MTTRLKVFTVVLEDDIGEDDAEHIIDAIKMIKGVQNVATMEINPTKYIDKQRIRRELIDRFL